ncbi:methyltransferase, TIGR04325 family [Desertivirga brevis]|uniref:methyltransferase, TIGR04325 family n=1 Tax=Desertivirga brevis TaxID=2810310 RepID=UPI001A972ECE|nr:methyltransferase, TIGR04325 family [Pedobacter sp. SYSU D00873]
MLRKLKKIFNKGSKKEKYGWFGNYSNWEAALDASTGYSADNILEKTKQSLLKVKQGEAVYERDSVLFDKKEYPFAVISCLLNIAVKNNNTLNLIDFGGSLGSTWFQVKDFIPDNVKVTWTIVEQEKYVECGKQFFEDEKLKFAYSIEECLETSMPSVVLLSGSVQYLSDPHSFLKQLASYSFDYLIFDRTAFVKNKEEDQLTVQIVPPDIYSASYPSWFFNEKRFLNHFNDYKVVAEFVSFVEGETDIKIDGVPAGFDKGFFLKR